MSHPLGLCHNGCQAILVLGYNYSWGRGKAEGCLRLMDTDCMLHVWRGARKIGLEQYPCYTLSPNEGTNINMRNIRVCGRLVAVCIMCSYSSACNPPFSHHSEHTPLKRSSESGSRRNGPWPWTCISPCG